MVWVLVLKVVCGCFLALASVRPGAQCFSQFLYNKTSEKLKIRLSLRALGKPDPGLPTWIWWQVCQLTEPLTSVGFEASLTCHVLPQRVCVDSGPPAGLSVVTSRSRRTMAPTRSVLVMSRDYGHRALGVQGAGSLSAGGERWVQGALGRGWGASSHLNVRGQPRQGTLTQIS